MHSYTLPETVTGRSSIVPPPPWYFSGDVLLVEFETTEAARDSLLIGPLRPAAQARAAAIFGDWQSCSEDREELRDPIRAQYREFYLVVSCELEGQLVARCPFCYVDADFSLVRGLIQGYPKKLGDVHMTRPVQTGRAGPLVASSERFAATFARHGRRLAELEVTLREPADAPACMLAPLVHHRLFPAWDQRAALVDELVLSSSDDQGTAEVWRGEATLWLGDGPNDEVAATVPVVEVLGGFRLSFSETISEGRVVWSGV